MGKDIPLQMKFNAGLQGFEPNLENIEKDTEKERLLQKITAKKEFSQLPKKDIEKAFELFNKEEYSELEKVKLTRDLLKKIFTAFMGRRIMNPKDKDARWFLLRHVSTKERFDFYEEVYKKLFKSIKEKEISVIDLGAGINGLSYGFFPKNKKINYFGIEGVKQLVDVVNYYFKKNKIDAKMIFESLFELEKIKKIIKKQNKPRICFLFKTIDSLEMLERDYTKKFLKKLVPLCEKFVVSFATESMAIRTRFRVERKWIKNFIEQNFKILDDFVLGNERYIVFCKG